MKPDQEGLKRLLSIFTSKDEYRVVLSKPFVQGDYIVATNAYVLIRIPKDYISDHGYEHKSQPEVHAKFHRQGYQSVLSAKSLRQALMAGGIDPDSLLDNCPNCDEEGDVEWTYTDNNGCTHERMDTCPICDGTGVIDNGLGNYIQIGKGWVHVPNIVKILRAMSLFEVETAQVLVDSYNVRIDLIDEASILLASYGEAPKGEKVLSYSIQW